MVKYFLLLVFFCFGFHLIPQKANEMDLFFQMLNCALEKNQEKIQDAYDQVQTLYQNNVDNEAYKQLLQTIGQLKKNRIVLQNIAKQFGKKLNGHETYAFWNVQEVPLSQFLFEYGAQDALYLIPQDLGTIKIQLNSHLAVPKALFSELIENILRENGIGIKQLNPFVRQLVRLRLSYENVVLLTDQKKDLESRQEHERVVFLFPLKNLDLKKQRFIETLAINDNVNLQFFEKEVAFLGDAKTVYRFVQLVEFLSQEINKIEIETVVTKKLTAKEAKEFLELIYLSSKNAGYLGKTDGQMLKIVASLQFKHLLVLCGTQEEINEAKKMIAQMEQKIEDPVEKTIFWYTCKHSQPDELANVLQKVYPQLNETPLEQNKPQEPAQEGKVQRNKKNESDAFIIDPKTSALIMIVEKRNLEDLKRLITKLDVPKRMVKIEVLLFEKKSSMQNQIGLSNLGVGNQAKVTGNGIGYKKGILDFILSNKKNNWLPSFDFAYRFLLKHQDIQINSAPSVTTLNATPAVISLTEEISVDMGAVLVETKDGAIPQQSFQREKFGITLKITPNVNIAEEDHTAYITLDTDINFDTINSNTDNRPDVSKRHVENQVRIQDGQTLIIGGLRRKDFDKKSEKVPFLGEIPGIGKLFGNLESKDNETEMFIFITPTVISDPVYDIKKVQIEELRKRPGDIPEFIEKLDKAKQDQKQKQFEKSMQLVLR
jgi:general secretion pathway protein D